MKEAVAAGMVGLAVWNFQEGSLAERIERCATAGFDAVSLILRDAASLCRGENPEVENVISRRSLSVTIHGGMAAPGEPIDVDALLADFRAFAAWHARTGALVSVNYDAAKTETGEKRPEAMGPMLKEMLSISDGAGFTVGIEDWPLNWEQLAAVNGLQSYKHFGILIDLGHLNIRLRKQGDPGGPFPVEAAQSLFDSLPLPINELHVHNNDGRRDLHAPPRDGTGDLAEVAGLLARNGMRCVSTIEIVPRWCGLTDEQGWEAAREALEFWRDAYASAIS